MKPSIPKGTRDFLPIQVEKRNFIFDTIKKVFVNYGYVPIETPAMESLTTLTGKYGDEGDKLLFKVLNNGDFLSKADPQALEERNSNRILPSISKRGLRYDLTVPFARYVVMNQNELHFPFKRYQIQPVWRADRPQKGRYQEFYQCDADMVGSRSLIYEAELLQMFALVFDKLNVGVSIKINNRKVLYGLAELCKLEDRFMDLTIAIDKLDKIGIEGVSKILEEKQIGPDAIEQIKNVLNCTSITEVKALFQESETGLKGIEEIETVINLAGIDKKLLEFDITLARGLNYYTGCIFEVKSLDVQIGSIAGGGRYDDLTASFGLKDMSGVGISFGAARIYDVMEELGLFPESIDRSVDILICCLDEQGIAYGFEQTTKLREAGIAADLYPEAAKLGKQLKYADKRHIPKAIILGEEEISSGILTLKDLNSGNQDKHSIEDIIELLGR